MLTQGENLGTTASGSNWINPANVLADDAAFAVADGETQDALLVTGFGFSLPASATVLGIAVTLQGQGAGATPTERQVRVALRRMIGTGEDVEEEPSEWETVQLDQDAETPVTIGGAADLRGLAWTAEQINSPEFGVLLSDNDETDGEISIQFIRVLVFYSTPFNSLVEAVGRRIQDTAARLKSETLGEETAVIEECVRGAITGRYSRVRPLVLVHDIAGDGSTHDFSLSDFAGWVDGWSSIESIECPEGALDPELLTADDWRFYRAPTNMKLRLYTAPAVDEIARVTYRAQHSDDASTVPASDVAAVADLAASIAATRMVASYAQMGDNTVGAASVDLDAKRRAFKELADRLEEQFEVAFGLRDEDKGAPASGTVSWGPPMADGRGTLTH